MGNEMVPTNFPKPVRRPKGGKDAALRKQKKLMGLEAAAIAYVQMKHGEYRGQYTKKGEDGEPEVNKRELMRRAGYSPKSLDHFDEYLATQDEFWELVELHELRRTDPNFELDQEHNLWKAVGGEALRNLYERVFYYPHTLSTADYMRLVKLILDAGVVLNKMPGDAPESKSGELLGKMAPEQRAKALKGYKETLEKEMEEVERIERASKGLEVEGKIE